MPLSTFVKLDDAAGRLPLDQPPGPVPGGDAVLQPGAGRGARRGRRRDPEGARRDAAQPATLTGTFQGTAQAFQASLASQPYLIAAAIVVVYIILGMLYESYIHPLTILSTLPSAGVGALLMLMASGYELDVIALIGIILLIGIVKKNGIMMVDFALAGGARPGRSSPRTRSARPACCASARS